MPELAEVEYSRRQWNVGHGRPVREVIITKPQLRIFRDTDISAFIQLASGQLLIGSEVRGKQMIFRFGCNLWLGIHLGMNGELRCEPTPDYKQRKHDHLVLRQDDHALVFADKRLFGRVRVHQGVEPPAWWNSLAPSILSRQFTFAASAKFLQRRGRAPLKAVLLMQEQFPGIGNWMADEILWRARLHPAALAGSLDGIQTRTLWEKVRWVSRSAIRIISDDWTYPPSWLFAHRWEAGGNCPLCRAALSRATIGGRTTCWCPGCQPESTAAKLVTP